MLINNFALSPYSDGRWVLNVEDRNILINENTASLLALLKESTHLETVHKKFQETFNVTLAYSDFENLLRAKLGGYDIIVNDTEKRKQLPTRFLKYKVQLFGAHAAGAMASPFAILFRERYFYYILGITTFVTFQIFFAWQPLKYSNFKLVDLTLMAILVFPNILFHELGHIAACRQLGVKHGAMGFAVYWIFPVFFADVNNVWRVSKEKRTIVNLGGIFHQVIYSFVLAVAFLLTNEMTCLYASLLVMFSAFIQLNPFIRLDGYWILSDLAETPNLLTKATTLLEKLFNKSFIKRIIEDPVATITNASASSLLLLLYGVINYSFMFLFLIWSLFKYREETLYFPITVYNLLVKAIHLKIEATDLSAHYLSILLWYILFGSAMKNLYGKIKRFYFK